MNISLFRTAWCRATSSCPEEWSKANPARGQCAVTALVIQETVGGQLLRAIVNGESHYWNLLPDGVEIDATLQQFGDNPEIGKPEIRERDYVLSFPETVARYEILARRLHSVSVLLQMGAHNL